MKIFVCAVTILLCAMLQIAQGDRCRFNVPVRSSTIKCEDQVYHRTVTAIRAVNYCGQGKNGSLITIKDTNCIFERLGYIQDGELLPDVVLEINKFNFPRHYKALTKGTTACAEVNTKESDEKDPFKHVDCRLKVFRDVCKHETCDWINTLD